MLEFESEISPQHIYSITEINQEIKVILETTIPVIWIQGEISNLKFHSSGHLYFSLKDKESQISCVMWRSRTTSLFFTPQDGMKVLALGKISVYHKRGYYQFDAIKIQPAGIGELQIAFDQLKQKLQEEGLFDEEFKKNIPAYPERIGVVTSPTGAAIQDIINVIQRRNPGIEIILNPVKVQGEGASNEISRAIDEFNEYKDIDILIIGRGGGSLEDLWAFNEEIVARAIFRSKIPIISAVGHEIDFSIADFVADLRAPTPSAAAELAVPDRGELNERVRASRKRMLELVANSIKYERDRLANLVNSYSFRKTPDVIRQNQLRLDELTHTAQISATHRVSLLKQKYTGLFQYLQSLSPSSILKRGYSICYKADSNEIISNAERFSIDESFSIQFYKGKISGKVTKIDDLNFDSTGE